MLLTDDSRIKISEAIEGNNDIKIFIAGRMPRKSAVKLFTEHVASINSHLKERVEDWTISYSLDPVKYYRMRSRAAWTSPNAPIVGVIHAMEALPAAEQVGILKSIELLEMYPADLVDIVAEIINLKDINGLGLTADALKTGASLCVQLNYASGNGGAGGCTASVCPPK